MKALRFLALLLTLICISARADTYSWSNLQSDIAGAALHIDRDLVNPWGLAASSGGTIWAADNGTGVATLYKQDGSKVALTVSIPTSEKDKKGGANPTGVVFNSTSSFNVTSNGHSGPARFIFVSEDGTISGWNPSVDGTHAIVAVNNKPDKGPKAAIYKGAALGVAGGHNFLYVTNFHSGRVETYN